MQHIKTVQKITDPGKEFQYEYEFGMQKTLQYTKKSELDDIEPSFTAAIDRTNEVDEAYGYASNDLNTKSQQLIRHTDISEVGADMH